MFVSVAVNIPSDRLFSYSVPPELEKEVAVGKRVLAPFGKRKVTGYILELTEDSDRAGLKEIISILDREPLFGADDLRFYRWASEYYLYPLGRLLKEIMPGGINIEPDILISLEKTALEADHAKLPAVQRRILEILHDCPSGISLKQLKKEFEGKDIGNHLKALQEKFTVTLRENLRKPDIAPKKELFASLACDLPSDLKLTGREKDIFDRIAAGVVPLSSLRAVYRNAAAVVRRLERKNFITLSEKEVFRGHGQIPILDAGSPSGIILSDAQEKARREIESSISSGGFSPLLLHGVTGSGKTEVYLSAIAQALSQGAGVIYLVPEIALTPQLLSRISARFGIDRVAVIHSGISRASRYDQWRKIRRGDIDVVIGARSAVFAPVQRLRLIIVDEEHDSSYKQDDRMRYNARDLAIIRAKQQSATVILGSATPGIQTFHHVRSRRYRYLSLPSRVGGRPLPGVAIIDMKHERTPEGRVRIFSRPLEEAIRSTLDAGRQVLLFLNRRGFHTFVCCYSCGYVFKCLNCSVTLTHHSDAGVLKCHYCGFAVKSLPLCPVCREGRIGTYGLGTERLEKEIASRFPAARVSRMDSDTTARKGAHERILKSLEKGQIDILIGTQMIAKGHDYPGVLLVGVLSADLSLNIPDFRSAERTFQLLTQVAGRGGRGDAPGRVFIQTFNPDHYAIRLAAMHDYERFYEQEISIRKELFYPPFSRIVSLWVSGLKKDRAKEGAEGIGRFLRERIHSGQEQGRVDILGPSEAVIARIKGRYRWQILLKGRNIG
ncbi:MAG: primosomal protein N', partial [Syntrophales bacterium]